MRSSTIFIPPEAIVGILLYLMDMRGNLPLNFVARIFIIFCLNNFLWLVRRRAFRRSWIGVLSSVIPSWIRWLVGTLGQVDVLLLLRIRGGKIGMFLIGMR